MQQSEEEIERKMLLYKTMSLPKRFFGHLGTVLKHKKYVRKACFKMGLYRQGIFHDMSKFSPTEFGLSVKYYSGKLSPNAVDKHLNGSPRSWLHHKGRNKHHYEYWIDYNVKLEKYTFAAKMPMRYVAEMVGDRYAACVSYNGSEYSSGDPWDYYLRGRGKITIHEDTEAVLEKALITMRDEGEDAAFKYMKGLLKITKGTDYTKEKLGL